MKTYQKLYRFPLGAIKAEGFLKEQLVRGKAGIAGHLYELEPDIIKHPYIGIDYNAWGTSCAMRALLAFYEATGRKDTLNAAHRCLKWFVKNWTGDKKQHMQVLLLLIL